MAPGSTGCAGGPCHAANDAKNRSQAIIGAIDSISQPAATAFMPAFAAEHDIQHPLGTDRTDNFPDDAPMALLLAPHLAQHTLSLNIVNTAGLGLVARDIAILLALHMAQCRLGSELTP